jgi:hypothetical protein
LEKKLDSNEAATKALQMIKITHSKKQYFLCNVENPVIPTITQKGSKIFLI